MNNIKPHILVVDDDDGIRSLVKQYLKENGFLVSSAQSAEEAYERVSIIKFDLIVLDIMMSGKTGLEFTLENKKKIQTPIILLTAKGEPSERVEGLEIGADDYLPKPFEPKELILRINNILNKTHRANQKRQIDFDNIILEKMINNPGKTFAREDIANMISLEKERSIDVIITRLRKKIENNPKNPKYLQTIRGSGYVLWVE